MFNFTKKKTIIGVAGLVLSIVLAAVCGGFDVPGGVDALTSEQIVIRFFCVTGIALALGFLMLILFDWKMFLLSFGGLEVMLSLQFIISVNVSIGLIVLSLLCLGGLIFWFTMQYRNCKYNINGATTAHQQQKEQQAFEEFESLTAEDEQLKQSIKYLEKSIVLSSQMGAIYQVIKSEEDYYFHYIGSILAKPDWSKLITDFDYVARYGHKKDYIINRADIASLSVTLRTNPQFMDYGTLKIKFNGKKKKSYGLINMMEAEELKTFFGEEIEVKDKNKPETEIEEIEPDDKRKKVLNAINLTRYIFAIIASVFFTAYIFYNSEKTDLAFTIIAVIICLAPMVFYLLFQDYLSIRDVGKYTKCENDRLDFSFAVIIFPLLFLLKCLWTASSIVDYQIWKVFVYALIPLAVIMVVFFVVCKEYKKFKSCILVFLIGAIAFCPSFIYKVNSAFDFNPPEEVACEVIDMPKHEDKNGNVTYYLVVMYGDKEIKTEVGEITYNECMVGGEVMLLRYGGAFGIQTLYLG